MLDIKSCLKISFQGEVGFIICETGSSYDQIIGQVCARFNVPASQRAGLVLTNGQGYVFEQQLLEYFLLLFPCPELIFYLRMDWQKLRRALIAPSVKRRRIHDEITDADANADADATSETDYVAVPVHRQNCFLGALPSSASASSAAASVRRQNCFLQQRQQHQPPQPPSRALRQFTVVPAARSYSQPKRMRLQLCNKSRRSVPNAAPHVALLAAATAPRSIRI
ncbi:uncharacterized protein LOC117783408 [Drosophila innubila]|uniref:uncharacterized protein LOC117783408 n=1 Tax=Drosophila innubila TaxID=198719 RepID=UPI00148C0640|nr:uncharacterized protein LOC117783408 [Drosophila innubila]